MNPEGSVLAKGLMVLGVALLAVGAGTLMNRWNPADLGVPFDGAVGGFQVSVRAPLRRGEEEIQGYLGRHWVQTYETAADGVNYRIEVLELPREWAKQIYGRPDPALFFEPLRGRLGMSRKDREARQILSDGGRVAIENFRSGRHRLYRLQVTLPEDASYDQALYASRFLTSMELTPAEKLP